MHLPMQISFSQKGMTVAVGDNRVLLGRRSRIGMAVAFTLVVHLVLLLAITQSRTNDIDISMTYNNDVDTELYRPEPIPEPEPTPVHRLRQEPLPSTPPVAQTEVEPAPAPSPKPQPVQARTEPSPAPSPQIKVAPRQVDNLQAVNTPTAKAIPQPQPTVQDTASNIPTVSDEPAPSATKLKKKEDEQALDTKRQMAAAPALSDLNVHEAQVPDVQASPVAPSGLTANPSSRLAASGGAPAAGGAAGGQGASGLKGRGTATQALQNHEDCITRQTDGKPIPPNCHMQDFASMQSTGPRPDANLQAAAAARDARLKYKTAPGNYDYWKRVGHDPSAYHQTPDHPTPGQYSSAKDQRVMTGNVDSGVR